MKLWCRLNNHLSPWLVLLTTHCFCGPMSCSSCPNGSLLGQLKAYLVPVFLEFLTPMLWVRPIIKDEDMEGQSVGDGARIQDISLTWLSGFRPCWVGQVQCLNDNSCFFFFLKKNRKNYADLGQFIFWFPFDMLHLMGEVSQSASQFQSWHVRSTK